MIVPITIDTSLLGLGDLKTLRTLVALAGDSASMLGVRQIDAEIAERVEAVKEREPVTLPLAACQANLERKA